MAVARCRVVGEEILIAGPGHSSSSPDRRGEVLEILGVPGRELLRVRWGDGTMTVVPAGAAGASPAGGATRVSPQVWVVGSAANEATAGLAHAWRRHGHSATLVAGDEAIAVARPGDTVLGRLDVLPTLDGVEPGLLALLLLERRGIRVVNSAEAMLAAHDKLRSARLLAKSRLPHPATVHVRPAKALPLSAAPCVVKPRFGSWGKEVFRCETRAELVACFDRIHARGWFRRHGVLVQELLPAPGRDLRVLVAGGRVVGAAQRVAAAGEWRTNVSVGGSLVPAARDEDAFELARSAAAAVGAEFVGVDLLPTEQGYVVLELNGAVDFDETYSLGSESVFDAVADALGIGGSPSASA